MRPTLTVVTICYNSLPGLIDTCRSVDKQTVLPHEHLIIDGSTDEEIVNWLLQNPQPAYRRWIHERDGGISDAFNKGIRNSRGSVIHLLNSADKYATAHAIETVMERFEADETLMWTHSQYIQHRGDIDVITGLPFEKSKLWKGMRTIAHSSMFIKKEVYDRHGVYNTTYKIAMDYDMLIRIRDEKFAFIPVPLVYFAPGGVSSVQFKKGQAEVKKSYIAYAGKSMKITVWQWRQQLLHWFMQTKIGRKWFQWKNS